MGLNAVAAHSAAASKPVMNSATARMIAREVEFVTDSPLEGDGFELSETAYPLRDSLKGSRPLMAITTAQRISLRTTRRPARSPIGTDL